MSDRSSKVGLQNEIGVDINPATEEGLQDIVDAIEAIPSAGGEQYPDNEVVGAAKKGNLILGTDGSNYQVISVDSSGKINVNASIDTTGLATSAKQLPDNHQVTVSNIASTPLITGFATSAKQDTLDTSVNTLLKPASTLSAVTTLGTITNVVHVDDNAGSLTVDNSALTKLDAAINSNKVDVNIVSGGTGGGTATVLTSGNTTVATAGTAVVLGAALATKSIYIRAKLTNTGNVYVGDSTVDATTNKGIILAAGDSVILDISDRATVYVDSDVNGEGVDYVCES